jgi:hypothetical protein
MSPNQRILQPPEPVRSNKQHEDSHSDKRGAQRDTNDIESQIRVRISSMLDPIELSDEHAGHNEDKGGAQVAQESALECYARSGLYAKQSGSRRTT